MSTAQAGFGPVHFDDGNADSRQPLPPLARAALLALVILLHVGGGWALTRVQPVRLVVGEAAPMEVRMVSAEPTPPAEFQIPPPPEDTPPPEPQPQLESMIQPPPPDLPPPTFPVQAPPPAPPKPKPAPPVQPPRPHPAAEPAPAPSAPAATAPAEAAAPRTVSASQVGYLTPPSPIYPARARRDGEKGTVTLRVLIDTAGRPAQVLLQGSSGHAALDESALSAVRAARFRPYAEGGVPQAVWVLIPINFVLQ